MHLGFQEYLAAREIRTRAFDDPEVLQELASHFGESWWQEVGLLLLALEDPSLFVPYMREVVKLPAFAEHPNLVEMCLDDAAETSAQPFAELLEMAPGKDQAIVGAAARWLCGYWSGWIPRLLKSFKPSLHSHPSADIRRWFQERAARQTMIDYANRAATSWSGFRAATS